MGIIAAVAAIIGAAVAITVAAVAVTGAAKVAMLAASAVTARGRAGSTVLMVAAMGVPMARRASAARASVVQVVASRMR